ncbi:MAG: hypothetical protein ACUVTZ_04325 [Armatimonadota bacterium]
MRCSALAFAVVLLTAASAALAAQGVTRERPAARLQVQDRLAAELERLNLTREQRAKIEQIRAEARQKVERIRASSLPQTERRQQVAAAMREARERIAAVLTPQQRARFLSEEGRGVRRIPTLEQLVQRLSLTEQQKAKLKPIVDEYSARMRRLRQETPAGPELERRAEATVLEFRKRVQEILTPEQRQRFEQMTARGARLLGPLGNVGTLSQRLQLTAEQRKRVAAVVEKAREEAYKLREQARSAGLTREQVGQRAQDLRNRLAGQIRPLLTKEQRVRFDRMVSEIRRPAGAERSSNRPERQQPRERAQRRATSRT